MRVEPVHGDRASGKGGKPGHRMVKAAIRLLLCAGPPMTRPFVHASIVTAILLLCLAAPVRATEYPGWGDTGWVYASKRDCCNEAIGIASQYSEQACTTSGGMPSPFVGGGGQRGSCSWQLMQDGEGNTMYRCYGEASIWCD
jgi:hypothetical protein